MMTTSDDTFWAPRTHMREPIAEIFHAAHMLDRAVAAHLAERRDEARALLRAADLPEVRDYTESLWGARSKNPGQHDYHRRRAVPDAPPTLPRAERIAVRMPTAAEMRTILAHWGFDCAFCGIPLVRKAVREELSRHYPEEAYWRSNKNSDQHAALQCMWLQFDHVLPHSRGGGNDLDNVAVTCAPCNYGRGDHTLAERGLLDPRTRFPLHTSWDGLERILGSAAIAR